MRRTMGFALMVAFLSLGAISGCDDGNDGNTGPAGPAGPEGPPGSDGGGGGLLGGEDGLDGSNGLFGSGDPSPVKMARLFIGGGPKTPKGSAFNAAPPLSTIPDGINDVEVAFFNSVCKVRAYVKDKIACQNNLASNDAPNCNQPYDLGTADGTGARWVTADSMTKCQAEWDNLFDTASGTKVLNRERVEAVCCTEQGGKVCTTISNPVSAGGLIYADSVCLDIVDALYPNVNGAYAAGNVTPTKVKAAITDTRTFTMAVGGASNGGFGGSPKNGIPPTAATILATAELWGFTGVDFNYEGGFSAKALADVINAIKGQRSGFKISVMPYMSPLWGEGYVKADQSAFDSCGALASASAPRFTPGVYHDVFMAAHESIDYINMQFYAGWGSPPPSTPPTATKVVQWMTCGGPVVFSGTTWGVGLDEPLRSEFLSKLVVGFSSEPVIPIPFVSSSYTDEYQKMNVAGFVVFDAEMDFPDYSLTNALLATPPGGE